MNYSTVLIRPCMSQPLIKEMADRHCRN